MIGDVHGMSDELSELLAKLQPTKGDEVIFVGDLVDKGPDSAGVVRIARELSERCSVVLVEGNHEDTHRRYRKNLDARPEVAAKQAANKPELAEVTAELSQEDIEFLERSVLYHQTGDYLVVHGGIPGTLTELPDDVEALSSKERKRLKLVLRTRKVDRETGAFLALDKCTASDPWWSELYDGRFGHVVYGHQPFMDGPKVEEHSTGIDTGCVHGGRLSSLVIDASGERSIVDIKCGRKFAELLED